MKALTVSLAALAVALASPIARAQAAPGAPTFQAAPAPAYVPPLRGAPSRRVGGSSRGAEQSLPRIYVVAPDHIGLTTAEQPVLYWFISKPTQVKLEITLIDESGEKPMLELPLGQVAGPAIHALDLARHGIRLSPGVEYQWTVTLVTDPADRSGDVISGGAIKRVDMPAELRDALKTNPAPAAQAGIYAREGIWYDAIHRLSALIAAQPGNGALRAQRAALAEQVGLSEVAAFDRTR